MGDRVEEECVLCGSGAEKVYVDHRNAKYVICPVCTEYRITCRAEENIAGLPAAVRSGITKQAKNAPDGTFLHVRVPSAAHQPGVAQPSLDFEYVSRNP